MRFLVQLTAHGVGAFVQVPRDVSTKMGLKGRPKVRAVIAGAPYRGSLMPMGDGTFGLGVLKSIQKQRHIDVGDTITVELEPDSEERTVVAPDDLAAVLHHNSAAAAAWEKLSSTNKKELARSLEEAKKPETRLRRLASALDKLARN